MGDSIKALFPAHAGVILDFLGFYCLFAPFPRIRGGDPAVSSLKYRVTAFSPHTRG